MKKKKTQSTQDNSTNCRIEKSTALVKPQTSTFKTGEMEAPMN